jgi:hypothetical protein
MSFWVSNPVKLFEDINVIPNEKQPYDQRMNTLTRLILLLAIVLYLFKVKGSLQFLIFGVVFIIILYYSQSDDMQKNVTREPFVPQGMVTENTPLGQILYDVNNGPGRAEYRRIPIEAPSPAMASEWGGYHPQINKVQDLVVPPGYSREIAWGRQNPSGVTRLPPPPSSGMQQLPYASGVSASAPQRMRENLGIPAVPSPPSVPQTGEFGSIGVVGGGTNGVYSGTPLPFALGVDGPDHRFAAGNSYFIHRRVTTDPGHVAYYPQPLNRGGGLESHPEYKDSMNSVGYQGEQMLNWSPEHLHSARTAYQRAVFPDDKDGRTGPYRAASILGGPDQYNPRYDGGGDGYRNIGDLPGNNQYYVTNPDPFAGLFAIRTESAHMDLLTADGHIIPQYRRDGTKIEDYIEAVADRQTADELYFRDSMVEAAAAKIAETEYQYRMGPVRPAGMRF